MERKKKKKKKKKAVYQQSSVAEGLQRWWRNFNMAPVKLTRSRSAWSRSVLYVSYNHHYVHILTIYNRHDSLLWHSSVSQTTLRMDQSKQASHCRLNTNWCPAGSLTQTSSRSQWACVFPRQRYCTRGDAFRDS